MKIIQTATAPNARRVRIFLAEKGVSIPLETIPFEKDALRSEAMTRLNPLQKIPVLLLDDGTAISESVAICRYVEELHPAPALFGTGPVGRATVEMWQRRMELNLLLPTAQAFRHLHPSMAGLEVPQVKEWGEANKPRVLDMLAIMDRHLAIHSFLAGDAFSIADITGMIAIDFMRAARIQRPETLAHVSRWHSAVSTRPSATA